MFLPSPDNDYGLCCLDRQFVHGLTKPMARPITRTPAFCPLQTNNSLSYWSPHFDTAKLQRLSTLLVQGMSA